MANSRHGCGQVRATCLVLGSAVAQYPYHDPSRVMLIRSTRERAESPESVGIQDQNGIRAGSGVTVAAGHSTHLGLQFGVRLVHMSGR